MAKKFLLIVGMFFLFTFVSYSQNLRVTKLTKGLSVLVLETKHYFRGSRTEALQIEKSTISQPELSSLMFLLDKERNTKSLFYQQIGSSECWFLIASGLSFDTEVCVIDEFLIIDHGAEIQQIKLPF